MSSLNITKARQETLATSNLIHFNNAGSSLMPTPVSNFLYDFLKKEELTGGYETAASETAALDNFYTSIGKLINCKPNEVAYVENATRAWDMAFYAFKFEAGDKILTTISEYGSNVIAYLQQAQRYGVEVVFVPDDEHGQIDTEALEKLIDNKTKLISISHIPTGGGLVNPAKEVGRIANKHGVPFLLDACQSIGQLDFDVKEIGCDMASGTGRKFLRGPRGTGLLYIREELANKLTPPMLDQHSADLTSPTTFKIHPDARRFENWEQYFAGKAALGVAADYAMSWGMDNIQNRVFSLATELRTKLETIDGITLTDQGAVQCGIITFMAVQKDPNTIKTELSKRNINVSVSDGSGSLVSFVQRDLTEVVRASVHYFNTEDEIETFIAALNEILNN